MPNDATRATAEAMPESTHLARLHFLHSEMLAQTEAHNTHVARREDEMIAASPIMTLFREFEVKYRQAGDISFEEEIASGLLDECNSIEKRIMALPVSSEQDLAAKLIVNTRYGDFVPGDIGTGGLLDQALSILAVRQHPDAELLKLAAERNRLVEIRNPLRATASRLSDEADRLWEAKGHTDRKDVDAYMAHCGEVGLLSAEEAREAIDNQIFPLDNKIRAIPAQTVAGLKVKFDLLRDYLPIDYVDEEPREDQDFDVCLLNELDDEINRLAEASKPAPASDSPIMKLFGRWNEFRNRSDEEGISDEEVHRRCAETDAVMVQISALPPTSALDFAAKLSCITHYGAYDELSGDVWGVGSALVREAAALVGHPEHVSRDHMGKGGGS